MPARERVKSEGSEKFNLGGVGAGAGNAPRSAAIGGEV